ncbi:MAG: Tol-Pal system beta propeller repeat protein TolB [Burkholderiales bacterium]|nr:Tol-Pal system beta propeller repeat protein TolB [Burkholderiales bacterium]
MKVSRLFWKKRFVLFLLLMVASVAPYPVCAQLTIDIIGGSGATHPISIVPFSNEATYPLGISGIVGGDLIRSGRFRLVSDDGIVPRPYLPEEVNVSVFRARGVDAVVVGSMRPLPDGRTEVRFALIDTVKQETLVNMAFSVTQAQFRAAAHRIADIIYEKLTGEPGIFSTRIAYITQQGKQYQLQVADADGDNPQTIVTSSAPLISPRFSPDGSRIAYVSFENEKPVVYVQSLLDGSRKAVANFRGSNSAPAWSPDGKMLVVTLSREGGSQLFMLSAEGGAAQRLMSSPGAIDTEAAFMPDGQSILFTSDRGGSPQIYRLWVADGRVERITFEGTYNVSPRPLPDGKGMVFVRRDSGRFQIATMDFQTRQVLTLTQGPMDESPSIAPTGRYVLYSSTSGGRSVLSAVSIDGTIRQRIGALTEQVREPAWGPII